MRYSDGSQIVHSEVRRRWREMRCPFAPRKRPMGIRPVRSRSCRASPALSAGVQPLVLLPNRDWTNLCAPPFAEIAIMQPRQAFLGTSHPHCSFEGRTSQPPTTYACQQNDLFWTRALRPYRMGRRGIPDHAIHCAAGGRRRGRRCPPGSRVPFAQANGTGQNECWACAGRAPVTVRCAGAIAGALPPVDARRLDPDTSLHFRFRSHRARGCLPAMCTNGGGVKGVRKGPGGGGTRGGRRGGTARPRGLAEACFAGGEFAVR